MWANPLLSTDNGFHVVGSHQMVLWEGHKSLSRLSILQLEICHFSRSIKDVTRKHTRVIDLLY